MARELGVRPAYGRFAKLYDLLDFPFEVVWYRRWRRRLLVGVRGRVLDVGAGTGKNGAFVHHADSLISLDQSLAAFLAGRAFRRFARGCDVVGSAEALPFANQMFDSVIATFTCCVLGDPTVALKEIARVLTPKGVVVLLEFDGTRVRQTKFRVLLPALHRFYGVRSESATLTYLSGSGLDLMRQELRLGGAFALMWATPQQPSAAFAPGAQAEC